MMRARDLAMRQNAAISRRRMRRVSGLPSFGSRFSMKAQMPSSASRAIMFSIITSDGVVVGLGERHFELAVERFLADPDDVRRLRGDLRAPARSPRRARCPAATTRLTSPMRGALLGRDRSRR